MSIVSILSVLFEVRDNNASSRQREVPGFAKLGQNLELEYIGYAPCRPGCLTAEWPNSRMISKDHRSSQLYHGNMRVLENEAQEYEGSSVLEG